MPDLAYYGRFGGLSRESGPTDHPAAERPVKRKYGKNNRAAGQWSFGNPEQPRDNQIHFLNGRKRFFVKLLSFFWWLRNNVYLCPRVEEATQPTRRVPGIKNEKSYDNN